MAEGMGESMAGGDLTQGADSAHHRDEISDTGTGAEACRDLVPHRCRPAKWCTSLHITEGMGPKVWEGGLRLQQGDNGPVVRAAEGAHSGVRHEAGADGLCERTGRPTDATRPRQRSAAAPARRPSRIGCRPSQRSLALQCAGGTH